MTPQPRPLSPHLQVYRPQMTSVLSILHRISGLILAAGTLLIIWWFWAIMSGPKIYALMQDFFMSWFGTLLLMVWSLCMFYHLCNGIRHLVWDTGMVLEIRQAYLAGKIVVGTTLVLTVLAWLI